MNPPSFRLSVAAALVAAVSMIPAAGECIRFAVVGDTQLTFDNPLAEPRIFMKLLEDMKRQDPRPEFLLHTGDIITGWTSDPAVLAKQYDGFRAAVRGVRFPVVVAMGNHEGYTPESMALFRRHFGAVPRSFNQGGWHFILLDDAGADHYKSLGAEQEEWLRKDLEKSRGMKGTFVALHVPLVADEMEGWLEVDKPERDRLHALFLANNVKAVFQGHVHTYEMCVRDGIRYMISGGGGGPLEHWPPVAHSYHYLIVDADEGSLSIFPRRLPDIEAEVADRNVPKPVPVAAPAGTLLEGFEGAAGGPGSRWSVYNDLVKVGPDTKTFTEGAGSLRMDFDFAVSLWPMVIGSSATPYDLTGAKGLSVDVWASPSLFARNDEIVKVQVKLGKCKSAARELKPGAWTTLRWEFGEAAWDCGGKGGVRRLGRAELGAVEGFALEVVADPTVPRKDWERWAKGHILLDNLRAF